MMRRDATPYAAMGSERMAFTGQDVSKPAAGFYRTRLRSGGVACGVEIRFGAPLDPETSEELDRSWRWMAFVNGTMFDDWDRIWPACAGEPITEIEYQRYCQRQGWARHNAPDSAYADPARRRDPLSRSEPLPF